MLKAGPKPGSVSASTSAVDYEVCEYVLVDFCSKKATPELKTRSVEESTSEPVLEDVVTTAARGLVGAAGQ